MDHNIESFRLRDRYILRFINSKRFAEIRGKVEVKRSNARKLSEAYLGTYNVETEYGGREIQEVFTNPSAKEFGQLIAGSEYASVRASLYPDTGDLYLWEGSRVQHHDMHHALFGHHDRYYIRLFLDRSGISMHPMIDPDQQSEEEIVKKCRVIRRLFGPNPNITYP